MVRITFPPNDVDLQTNYYLTGYRGRPSRPPPQQGGLEGRHQGCAVPSQSAHFPQEKQRGGRQEPAILVCSGRERQEPQGSSDYRGELKSCGLGEQRADWFASGRGGININANFRAFLLFRFVLGLLGGEDDTLPQKLPFTGKKWLFYSSFFSAFGVHGKF